LTAVELARLAGAEIVTAFAHALGPPTRAGALQRWSAWRDPVSDVDHRVELLIAGAARERFPEHGIIGEEIDERSGRTHEVRVGRSNPIDGTRTSSMFPLFAASIGVLYRERPIAGRAGCATSHALRAGVYHAHRRRPAQLR